ncbi:MAG: RNA polymerase sigma factor [Ornithinimicrobium sp.]
MPDASPPSNAQPEAASEAQLRAFREYVQPEIEVLLRVATSLAGRAGGAEDLVQETLIRAFRGIESFDGRYPRAWLLTILRRTHINMHRRQRPDVVGDFEALSGFRPAFGADASASPEDHVLDQTLHPALAQAVDSLDSRFRQALLLVDVDQLSYAEAAAALDVPVGTVMSRLSRAREKVRRHLGHEVLSTRRLQ